MIKGKFIYFQIIVLLFCSSCQQTEQPIYQLSTIELLMAGNFDGRKQVESLKNHGDFGIGTFDKLDGEMIFYKGEIFKATSDGTVCKPIAEETTPYASVCKFQSSIEFSIENVKNIAELDSIIKQHLPNPSNIYAIEISGTFDSLKVRSVVKQQKPYRPLIDVVKQQAVFNLNSITGLFVGFYAPSSVKSIMVKGLHLHFLSSDRKKGGHVLSVFTGKTLHCRVGTYQTMNLDLFQKNESQKHDTEQNQLQSEIEKVEK